MTAEPVPWLPASLRAHDLTVSDAKSLAYIVIDEIVDDVATLAIHPWPVADEQGRVRFPELGACRHAAVSVRALETELYHGWLEREPRVGDVFGAALTDAGRRRLSRHDDTRCQLRSLLSPPVYDLSPDARIAAKLAYYAAMAPVLPGEKARRWNLSEKEASSAGPARVRPYLGAPPASEPHG